MAEKNILRSRMLAQRKTMDSALLAEKSQALHTNIYEDAVWKNAGSVGLYMALPQEVPTIALVERAWQEGKQVYLPLCHKKQRGEMDFIACLGQEDLALGAYNIMEPTEEAAARSGAKLIPDANTGQLDILLVPGVAFDKQGYRIGFGGGYYDRFLQRLLCAEPKAKTRCIGMALAWQIVEKVPYDTWDIPMHGMVTEESFIWI